MSKGAGGIGGRHVGNVVRQAVGRIHGLHRAVNESGMRGTSLTYWRGRFRGLSPAGVRELAEHHMAPVRVALYRKPGGGYRVTVEDGRHRLQAAREAGATHVAVEARIVGERGGSSGVWRGRLRT